VTAVPERMRGVKDDPTRLTQNRERINAELWLALTCEHAELKAPPDRADIVGIGAMAETMVRRARNGDENARNFVVERLTGLKKRQRRLASAPDAPLSRR
jgi:hypothetical protein